LDIVKAAGGPLTAHDEYIEFEYDEFARKITYKD